jgi:hypothetical protein
MHQHSRRLSASTQFIAENTGKEKFGSPADNSSKECLG